MITDICVHSVGEINGTRAFGKLHDLSTRCKNIDFVREQVDFDAFDKFQRIACRLLHFEQSFNPLAGTHLGNIGVVLIAFIKPVSGDTVIRHILHVVSTNLDFNRHTMHASQNSVKGLIAIGFGNGNVVFKFARNRLV